MLYSRKLGETLDDNLEMFTPSAGRSDFGKRYWTFHRKSEREDNIYSQKQRRELFSAASASRMLLGKFICVLEYTPTS